MLGATACGNNAFIPDLVDAGPDSGPDADLCACQPAATLHAEQITRVLEVFPYLNAWSPYKGSGVLCEEGTRAIGGGCTHQPSHSSVEIRQTGNHPSEPEDSWTCVMSNRTPESRTMDLHIICLAPGDIVEQPAGCGCAVVEPLHDRIVRTTSTATLSGYDSAILGATCQPDAVLVGGGCSFDSVEYSEAVTVSRTGIEPTLPLTWICGWNNSGDVSGTIEATAICITPPSPGTAPEAEPLAERITYVHESRTLPTNNSLNNTVACAAGDTLLLGGCIVDRPDPQSDQVTLFQQGFDATNPNAWRCGWNNPTDTTPTATATAICLRPSAY
jgi:hypothetical protein